MINRKDLPTISVVIPAYNEEKNLKRLFASLKGQDYPRKKIEYIVVDDGSTDETSRLSKRFGAKVIKVKTKDIELNKGIGMHAAKGEYVYWMDADMQVTCDDFFSRLAQPLIERSDIGSSFTAEFSLTGRGGKVKSSILRFISYHPLQHDPLFIYLSTPIESTIVESNKNYDVCKFVAGKVPVVGRIMYRRKSLLATDVGKGEPFIDMEAVETYTRAGHDLFAYVPKAKIRHYHAETLSLLVRKRLRNLERDYIPNYEHKYFKWFDPNSPKDVTKMIFWVFYVNLFVPELVRGIYKSLEKKDRAFLWQPIVSIATTDAILWKFLMDKKGRGIIFEMLGSLIKK